MSPQNGKIEWSIELPGKYKWRSSPTAGDGKVYIMNHNGEVLVISSQSGEILTSWQRWGVLMMITPVLRLQLRSKNYS